MALEIERRFRVASDAWRESVVRSTRITQGYLAITEDSVTRVRVRDTNAYLTIKSRDGGLARQEFEYAVSLADAQALLKLCGRRILEKIRHEVNHGGYCWEIDEYLAPFEVTLDPSFSNAALAQRVEAFCADAPC